MNSSQSGRPSFLHDADGDVEPKRSTGEGSSNNRKFPIPSLSPTFDELSERPVSLTFLRAPTSSAQLSIPTPLSPSLRCTSSLEATESISSPTAQISPCFPVSTQSALHPSSRLDSIDEAESDKSSSRGANPVLFDDCDDSDAELFDGIDIDVSDEVSMDSLGPIASGDRERPNSFSGTETSPDESRGLLSSEPDLSIEKPRSVVPQRSAGFVVKSPKAVGSPPHTTSKENLLARGESGLFVSKIAAVTADIHESLSGRPGLFSSRPSGQGLSSGGKREKLISSFRERGSSRLTDTRSPFQQRGATFLGTVSTGGSADREREANKSGLLKEAREQREGEEQAIPFFGRSVAQNKAFEPPKHLTSSPMLQERSTGEEIFDQDNAGHTNKAHSANHKLGQSPDVHANDSQPVADAMPEGNPKPAKVFIMNRTPVNDSERFDSLDMLLSPVTPGTGLPPMTPSTNAESKAKDSSPVTAILPYGRRWQPSHRQGMLSGRISLPTIDPTSPVSNVQSSLPFPNNTSPSSEARAILPQTDRSESAASSGEASTTSSTTSEKRSKHKRKTKLQQGLGRLLRGKSSSASSTVGPRIADDWNNSDASSGMGSGDVSSTNSNLNCSSPTEGGGSSSALSFSNVESEGRSDFSDYRSEITDVDSMGSEGFVSDDRQAKQSLTIPSGEKEVAGTNKTAEDLEKIIQQAQHGKSKLSDVLSAMYVVSTRVEAHTLDNLYKYLSSPGIVEKCVDFLRRNHAPKAGSLQNLDEGDVRIEWNPHQYVLVQAFTNGQAQLRRALMANHRARSEFLAYFEDSSLSTNKKVKIDLHQRDLKLYDMATILSSMLHESPGEMADIIGARKGFLTKLVYNHVHNRAVADFLVKLCAPKALTITESTDELRYGAPNVIGIVLLARDGVPKQLVKIFEEATGGLMVEGMDAAVRRARQEACLYCMLEMSKRTLVIPRFDKKNCLYGSRRMKQINAGLEGISVFKQTALIEKVVDFGLGALFATPGDKGVSVVAALKAVIDLLHAVEAGSKAKLASTRKQMSAVSTRALEEVVVNRVAVLTRLATLEVGERGSLQLLRLTIIEMMTSLFRSRNGDLVARLARSGIPGVLFQLVLSMEWSSMMQAQIVECVRLAFESEGEEAEEVQRLWMEAMDGGLALWGEVVPSRRGGKEERGYYGAFVAIGLILRSLAERSGGKERLQKLMGSHAAYQEFQKARAEVLDEVARMEGDPIAGPKPEKTTESLLASAASLNALSLDNIDAV